MPFYPLQTLKIKILKNENICCRYHHFTDVYQKSQSYDVWFLRYRVLQTKYFVIMDCFLPFYTPRLSSSPSPPAYGPGKSKFWKKWKKKKFQDIIILQMFTINDSHMTYGFSDMECNRQNFWSFWTVFCPFAHPHSTPPSNSPENQNFENFFCPFTKWLQPWGSWAPSIKRGHKDFF